MIARLCQRSCLKEAVNLETKHCQVKGPLKGKQRTLLKDVSSHVTKSQPSGNDSASHIIGFFAASLP